VTVRWWLPVITAALLLSVAAPDAFAAPSSVHDAARLISRGRSAEAEAVLTRAVARRPRDPQLWLWLGVARFNRGHLGTAERALAQAARLAPHDATILVWWGHLLARAGRVDEAVSVFERALLARGSSRTHRVAEQALRVLRPVPGLPAAQVDDGVIPVRPGAPQWVLNVDSYRLIAQFYNRRLSTAEAARIAEALLGYSRHFDIDPRLVVALIVVESGFQPRVVSRAGATGLGQLMPGTARALGVNPWDPVQNLYGAIRYLRGNLDRFGWDKPHLALAAYNAGRGAVARYDGIPPYAETQWYVANVSSLYRRLLAIEGKIPELRRSSRGGLGED
jgi:soluble lytic murein transglycosylase-like protein